MPNKIPVFESISEGWAIFKFRPIAPAIYLIISMVIALLPMVIAGGFSWYALQDFIYYQTFSPAVIWLYVTFFISIFFMIIFSLGFHKMVRDAYYKKRSTFIKCLAFSISKALKATLSTILFIYLEVGIIMVLMSVFAIPFFAITSIGLYQLSVVLIIIAYMGAIIFLFPLTMAYYFSLYCTIFTPKSIWQSIGDGFSLIFRQGNFWRSIALLALQFLIIISIYVITGLIGLLLYYLLPMSIMIPVVTIIYLLLISFISVFSSGTIIAAYEKITQKEQELLENS